MRSEAELMTCPLDVMLGVIVSTKAAQSDCEREGAVKLRLFGGRQGANEIRERRLWQAHQFIAMDTAFVFESFFNPNVDLGV